MMMPKLNIWSEAVTWFAPSLPPHLSLFLETSQSTMLSKFSLVLNICHNFLCIVLFKEYTNMKNKVSPSKSTKQNSRTLIDGNTLVRSGGRWTNCLDLVKFQEPKQTFTHRHTTKLCFISKMLGVGWDEFGSSIRSMLQKCKMHKYTCFCLGWPRRAAFVFFALFPV